MLDHFRNKFLISDAQWNAYIGYFQKISVPAKTILLQEGKVSKKAFLIEKGCIRAWFNNDGKDVTFQFFFENSTVASIESLRKKKPSPVTLETLEPCTLWLVQKTDLDRIIAKAGEIKLMREIFFDAIFERTFDYMKHFLSFIRDTPLQRYNNLRLEKPEIIQRIPQHYIASYLGISTVHLSRIKGQLARQKKQH